MSRIPATCLALAVLLGAVAGCAPNPYERLALVFQTESSPLEIATADRMPGCIAEKLIPTDYKLKRERFELEIASVSGHKGFMPRLYFHAKSNTALPLVVSGEGVAPASMQPYEYQWVSVGKSEGQLDLAIVGANNEEYGAESFVVKMESCEAVELDAL